MNADGGFFTEQHKKSICVSPCLPFDVGIVEPNLRQMFRETLSIYDDKTGAISSEQVSKWFSFGSPCHFERPQHDGLGCS